jgi:CMP-N-acetylneuraminic acid synthetase
MKDPLVTVYVTNFNYGRYVKQAVDSVLRQTFTDFELIIIDDGSTDGSQDIIRGYEGLERVRVVLQQNKGLNATSNLAVKLAAGSYVVRLDADDYLDENALLVLTNILESDPGLALVFPDYYYVDAHGKITGQERRLNFQTEVTLLDQPAHGACTMIRRDCLIEVNAYSNSYPCQDGYDLWLKIVSRYRVRNVNLPLFYYRRHGKNLTENQELILRTRSEILDAHAERERKSQLSAVGVIPVLGPGVDAHCLSLTPLHGKPLLHWTIEAALKSESLHEVIVSSPDPHLLENVTRTFGDRITLHRRGRDQALENVPYDAAVLEALAHRRTAALPDAVALMTTEAPLRDAFYVDKAVNVMRIFDVDIVLSVVPETDLLFQHDGSGLRPVGANAANGKMRFERDYVYRHGGGMSLIRREFYEKNVDNILSGRIGHIVLSRQAATLVRSHFDLRIAAALLADGQAR